MQVSLMGCAHLGDYFHELEGDIAMRETHPLQQEAPEQITMQHVFSTTSSNYCYDWS